MEQIKAIEEQRIGRVEVSGDCLRACNLALLFAQFTPIRTEYQAERDAFSYVGYSDRFDPVRYDEAAPLYMAMFRTEQDLLSGELVPSLQGFTRVSTSEA